MTAQLKRVIGIRVKTARKNQHISQSALAEKVGRTKETISNIERGLTAPTIETLERLGKALDVPLVEFFEGYDSTRTDIRHLELETAIRDLLKHLTLRDLKIAQQQILALANRNI